MSMTTEGYITEVEYVLKNSRLSSCNFKFEPAQAYRLEFSKIKYCLFKEDSGKNPILARLGKIEECKWTMLLQRATDVMNLSLAKVNKARVRLVVDDKLKTVESITLV